MNKQEFVKVLEKIEIAYKKKFCQEEYRLWFKEFQNISKEEFEKAIEEIIRTKKSEPKIAHIKAKISENTYKYYADDPYRHLYKNNEWGQFAN